MKITVVHTKPLSEVAALLGDWKGGFITPVYIPEINADTLSQLNPQKLTDSIVILEGDNQTADCLDACELPSQFFDVIVATGACPKLVRFAVKNSVADYLTLPTSHDMLIETLEHVRVVKAKRTLERSHQRGSVSAVMGCKGGVGSSFLSYQISQMLADAEKAQTLLLDFDLQNSSCSTYCDTYPEHSLLQALSSAQHLDSMGLNGYVHRLGSGLGLLAADKHDMPLVEDFPSDGVEQTLTMARGLAEHVIVDLPATVSLFALSTLQHCDHVYLVIDQSLASITQAFKKLKVLREELHVNSRNISVIVNQYRSEDVISVQDISDTLKIESPFLVPANAKTAQRVIQEAQSLHQLSPNDALTKSLKPIINKICGREEVSPTLLNKLANVFRKNNVEAYS
jgi:pilus assembly protein CpaE